MLNVKLCGSSVHQINNNRFEHDVLTFGVHRSTVHWQNSKYHAQTQITSTFAAGFQLCIFILMWPGRNANEIVPELKLSDSITK